jgi:hypothetical protein
LIGIESRYRNFRDQGLSPIDSGRRSNTVWIRSKGIALAPLVPQFWGEMTLVFGFSPELGVYILDTPRSQNALPAKGLGIFVRDL